MTDPDSPDQEQPRKGFWQRINWEKEKKALAKRGRIIVWTTCGLTAAGFLGRFFVPFELASHFRMQYFWVLLAACIILFAGKRWILAGIPFACLVLNALVIIPWYISRSVPPEAAESGTCAVQLMISNVNTGNSDHKRLISSIRKKKPDVIVLTEVNSGWIDSLQEIEQDYPHKEVLPRSDNFGIAVYSRLPFVRTGIWRFGEGDIPPVLIAEIRNRNTRFELIAVHTLPPISPGYFARRNVQLEKLAEYTAGKNTPCIAAGDMNITMWSHYYRKFIQASGLHDARKGFGIRPTWPTGLPFLYIPIDHCFCSRNIQVTGFTTGPRTGSDHLPIFADLLIKTE